MVDRAREMNAPGVVESLESVLRVDERQFSRRARPWRPERRLGKVREIGEGHRLFMIVVSTVVRELAPAIAGYVLEPAVVQVRRVREYQARAAERQVSVSVREVSAVGVGVS